MYVCIGSQGSQEAWKDNSPLLRFDTSVYRYVPAAAKRQHVKFELIYCWLLCASVFSQHRRLICTEDMSPGQYRIASVLLY